MRQLVLIGLTAVGFVSPAGAQRAQKLELGVLGTYVETDEGLPPASGQTYRLPAGAFFEVKDGLIVRVTTYYNLAAWLKQIAAPPQDPGP